jgi:hypothetical protein
MVFCRWKSRKPFNMYSAGCIKKGKTISACYRALLILSLYIYFSRSLTNKDRLLAAKWHRFCIIASRSKMVRYTIRFKLVGRKWNVLPIFEHLSKCALLALTKIRIDNWLPPAAISCSHFSNIFHFLTPVTATVEANDQF